MTDVQYKHPLLRQGFVSEGIFSRAEKLSRLRGHSIELTLNQMGALSDDKLVSYWRESTGLQVADASVSEEALQHGSILNLEFFRHNFMFPIDASESAFTVGMVDPTNAEAIRALEFAVSSKVEVRILPAGVWRKLWLTHIDAESQDTVSTVDSEQNELSAQDRNAPIARKLTGWIENAAEVGASDIHFEAKAYGLEVMYRVDGRLQAISYEPKEAAPSILSRLKVVSGLDLGIKSKPQDGRTSLVLQGRKLDVRVSVIPSIHGESAVLRLLDKPTGLLDFASLGFSETDEGEILSILQHRDGLFLVAGPTGSGKTTTLYACIEALREQGLKILSVEDPVEYQFDHVTQVQVSEKAGLDFAGTLRAFLRHDPEVILVGEIRDAETAAVAVQAAYTGHFVMASIHAIDSGAIPTRLENMGVERFKIDACLRGSVSQRLVGKLCTDCRQSRSVQSSEASLFIHHGLEAPEMLFEASGCPACEQLGVSGRTLVCEINRVGSDDNPSLVSQALRRASLGEINFSSAASLASK
ncbi:GspE/PulE family protein [Ponticaulis koreensis]|uniref:GspE/PulE family protein n=1 Tax=Ponticaulis koreensis TaxID=1123045 RepID=UPI0003B6090D|nr:GspE/PulE family protein [Ponticaulis koreensis]